jgi:hypothetical protein
MPDVGNPGARKQTIKEAVEDPMRDVGISETLIVDKIEGRKKNPIHEYRIWLAPRP